MGVRNWNIMDLYMIRKNITLTCAARMGAYLASEVRGLGLIVQEEGDTAVQTSGTMADCIMLNLHLRTAHRVLFHLLSFPCKHPNDLYNKGLEIEWEKIIPTSEYFRVHSHVHHPSVNDTRFPNLKLKDAVVDRIRKKTGKRPDAGSEKAGVSLFLRWTNEQADIFIDTSGETIAKHGYRQIPFQAPLIESLASGVIMATKWKSDQVFINPMCGSGTLVIEAALIASGRIPGMYRDDYSFMHLVGYSDDARIGILNKQQKSLISVNTRFIASDHDPNAIEASRHNAKTAGVDHMIDFQLCDFTQTEFPENESGIVILNPEYGERLGEAEELETLYSSIGDFFKKKCAGYTGYVFTGNLDLAKKVGLRAKRRIPFYNGKIDCRLLEFELYQGSREKS